MSWVKRILGVGERELITATYNSSTEVMTVTYGGGVVHEYKGNCTVWYEMPYMNRCSTFRETNLLQIWEYINHYGNPYPTAHLKEK